MPNLQRHLGRLQLSELEHPVDHVEQMLPRAQHGIHPPGLYRIQPAFHPKQLRIAEHATQRRTQLMAHARQKPRLRPVGVLRLIARLLQMARQILQPRIRPFEIARPRLKRRVGWKNRIRSLRGCGTLQHVDMDLHGWHH